MSKVGDMEDMAAVRGLSSGPGRTRGGLGALDGGACAGGGGGGAGAGAGSSALVRALALALALALAAATDLAVAAIMAGLAAALVVFEEVVFVVSEASIVASAFAWDWPASGLRLACVHTKQQQQICWWERKAPFFFLAALLLVLRFTEAWKWIGVRCVLVKKRVARSAVMH